MATRRPPSRIQIGHLTYRVKLSTAACDAEGSDDTRRTNGLSRTAEQRIIIRKGLAADYEAEVVLHEVLHQCLAAANCELDTLAKAGVEDLEEAAVATIAGMVLATLRRNPELVTYLTAE